MENVTFRTDDELKDLLMGNISECECELITESTPKCTKKSRITKEPYEEVFEKDITCKVIRKVLMGVSYRELLVRNAKLPSASGIDPDKKFKLLWGGWRKGSNVLIEYKGNFYLRVYGIAEDQKEYTYSDGTKIEKDKEERLNEFLPKQKEYNGGFVVNNLKLSSIMRLKIADKTIIKRVVNEE